MSMRLGRRPLAAKTGRALTYSRAAAVGLIKSATCVECGNIAALRSGSSVR